MKLRTGYFLSFLVCIYLVGGHWAVLQSVAWVGMLADYGRTYGAKRALEMTFDGKNPCSMCITIKVKKDQEEKQDLPLEKLAKAVKKSLLLTAEADRIARSDDFYVENWPAMTVFAVTRSQAPPRPVPRSGLV